MRVSTLPCCSLVTSNIGLQIRNTVSQSLLSGKYTDWSPKFNLLHSWKHALLMNFMRKYQLHWNLILVGFKEMAGSTRRYWYYVFKMYWKWNLLMVWRFSSGYWRKKELGASKRRCCTRYLWRLLEEHVDKYSKPQLRLWAQMINCGTHDDYVHWTSSSAFNS